MRHNWICYTTYCHSCGRTGLMQLWSDNGGWGYTTQALVAAAVNRIHPENSVMRCISCLSPVVTLKREPDSPQCGSTLCRYNPATRRHAGAPISIACPMHGAAQRLER